MALIKCNECGKEVSSKAGKCPNCGAPVEDPNLKWYQKNSKGNVAIMLIAIAFFFICCIIAISMWQPDSGTSPTSSVNNKYITLDEFELISEGMSYEEVCAIVGGEGTVMSEVTLLGSTTAMYNWYASNQIFNANVTFQDGKVISKAQFGLE